MPAIEIKNLTKKYKELTAVNNISLDINKGVKRATPSKGVLIP
jgi:ABC-type multidrug transport system ATPase subunit